MAGFAGRLLLWFFVPGAEERAADEIDAQKRDEEARRRVGQIVGAQHDAGERYDGSPAEPEGHQRPPVAPQPGLEAGDQAQQQHGGGVGRVGGGKDLNSSAPTPVASRGPFRAVPRRHQGKK